MKLVACDSDEMLSEKKRISSVSNTDYIYELMDFDGMDPGQSETTVGGAAMSCEGSLSVVVGE
jgi:hypothetical protein